MRFKILANWTNVRREVLVANKERIATAMAYIQDRCRRVDGMTVEQAIRTTYRDSKGLCTTDSRVRRDKHACSPVFLAPTPVLGTQNTPPPN